MTTPLPAAAAAMTKDEAVRVLTCWLHQYAVHPGRDTLRAALAYTLRALTAPAGVPDGWRAVPMPGAMVKSSHPQTVMNPDEVFEVSASMISDGRVYVRGEQTCWFSLSMISPAAAPPSEPPSGGISDATFEGVVAGVGSLPAGMGYAELEARHSPAEQGAREGFDRVVTDALTRTDGTGMFRVTYVDPDSVKNEVAKRQIFSGGDSISERLSELVDEYEFRGDGDYTPNENERALLLDFAMGLPEDDILMGLFTKPAAPRAGLTDGQIANAVAVLRELTGESKIDMPDQRADYLARMARRIFALAGPLVAGEVEPVAWAWEALDYVGGTWWKHVGTERPSTEGDDAYTTRNIRPLVYADTAKGG